MRTPEDIWAAADLPTRRLAGLALNPSTPVELLLRLLADAPLAVGMVLCRDRVLPDAVVDAVIDHPDAYTRSFFARNPHADPRTRARLLKDPDWFVRGHLAQGPRAAGPVGVPPLPDDAVVYMITTYEDEHLGGPFYAQISAGLREAMPTHPVAKVRLWGTGSWGSLPAETQAALLADPDAEVRERAARNARKEDPAWVESVLPPHSCHGRTYALLHQALSRAVVDSVLTAPAGPGDRSMIAGNPSLPPDVVALLAGDPDPDVRRVTARRRDLQPAERRALVEDPDPAVRRTIAGHPDLDPEERAALAADTDPDVRLSVSVHPAWSERERSAIDYQVSQNGDFGFHHCSATPRDTGAVRRDALSGHPLLRRAAARERALPPDLVALLAADDDLGVRVLLAQNHPNPPAGLLLRCFLEYTGDEREHLLTRPGFPSEGLAVHADDADPAVRRLAARDPGTAPHTVERLTRDPDPAVRAAFARHPNLPGPRLTQLLDDEELVHHAAANPALAVSAIRALVTSSLPLR
ncbi:HEAT repeat domain-containing protein [Streptomyces sp. ME08-AFT2]|uniref:HEAT repeat domain-containing protein n=1 Tax=Streptomyces sp. ME08-AFT2 TaxID=3028683 RepID=UPI0029A6A8A9|nr:HEAT repeat domain-containing protein [Streptomyces sp. ME08-AFT2]MDX3311854.1 HEAT repeat domain-containing protein [Streptomyces sp. ME08-AFT2]